MRTYSLNFNGYWVEGRISTIPKKSGVYLVYRCVYDESSVVLKEILYIGQAENLQECISSHGKKDVFLRECQEGETLCYSVAEIPQEDLNVAEKALIFAQKPRLNDMWKHKFEEEVPVSFQIEGKCKLLEYQNFTIK